MSVIQCQKSCEARRGCKAIEYWERGGRYCYECTDTSKITPFTDPNDSSYPVYVWIKSKLSGIGVIHIYFNRNGCFTGKYSSGKYHTKLQLWPALAYFLYPHLWGYWCHHFPLFHGKIICANSQFVDNRHVIKRNLHGGLKTHISFCTILKTILFLPLENKIPVAAPPCNIL